MKVYEDAPINAVGSGGIAGANQDPPGPSKVVGRMLRRKNQFATEEPISTPTTKKPKLISPLERIKKCIPKNHPVNKAFINPFSKPKSIVKEASGWGDYVPSYHTHTIEVPYQKDRQDRSKGYGWKKLKDASFSTPEAAHTYGLKYHTGKNDHKIRFRVVPLKEDVGVSPLYVSRKLINTTDVMKWIDEQGLVPSDDFHVTCLYSKSPVDWKSFEPDNNPVVITKESMIGVLQFRECAVISFNSNILQDRFKYFIDGGGSHDYPEYRPHMTISKTPERPSIKDPYQGVLVFGPEKFERLELE